MGEAAACRLCPTSPAPASQRPVSAGEYGLRNKREVWRVKFTLAKIRKAARELLTLDEKDPRRLFEGVCERARACLR